MINQNIRSAWDIYSNTPLTVKPTIKFDFLSNCDFFLLAIHGKTVCRIVM